MKLISTYIRLAIKVDPIGTSCTNVYDLAGRMIEKQYHTGATPALGGVVTAGASLESTDTFTYDAASRVITTRKGRYNIRTQHSYALDSQPLTETIIANREVYTSSRTYDAANRPLSHTFPNGKTTQWSYTARNLVGSVRYEGELIASNSYDAGFRQTNQNYSNGLNRVITYARKDNLRSTDRVLTKDDLNFSYTYAVDKQVTAESIVADQVENTSFTANYDAGNRLTAWNRAGADENHSQTWNYDDAGNWNSTTKDGDTESRNHSVSNQITQLGGNPVSHDLKGNLTEYKYGRKNYKVKYDLDNRIVSMKSNRRKVTYRYDALGRRIISKKNGNKTALIWWGDSECAEYKHGGSQRVVQHDIMGHPTRLNSVIARDTAKRKRKVKLQWYHKNYLDHVYAVSDKDGDIKEHYRYTAFGEPEIYSATGARRNTSAIGNTVMWNTRRYDVDNGLYYYKYRHYAANIGRWLGRDPIEEASNQANLYAFVGNDSIFWFDILGLETGSYQCDCDRAEVNKVLKKKSAEAYQRTVADKANIPASARNHPHSTGREFGGWVCCNPKTFKVTATGPDHSTTGPNKDGWTSKGKHVWHGGSINFDELTQCPKGTEKVAAYHSHPSGSRFSVADVRIGTRKYPLALGSEGGEFLVTGKRGNVRHRSGGTTQGIIQANGWEINEDGSLSSAPVIPIRRRADRSYEYGSLYQNPRALP